MSKKPVVVYGANGYTGRLVCEWLREYQTPFIAAGRNKKKIEEAMKLVPGISTADYEIVEVKHDVDSLAELLSGAKVLCNTVGPFDFFGETAVKAALKAGCHYMDSSGEPSYLARCRENYGKLFKEKNLVLAPSTAYMYTPLDIASHIVLEEGGIDTIEAVCAANGVPTYGSTQTILAMFDSDQYYLQDNEFVKWENGRGFEVVVPGFVMTQLAHPWGGGSIPQWLFSDGRVRNARSLTAFTNRPMFEQVIGLHKHYEDNLKSLPKEERLKELAKIADNMQPGMPPRENRLVHRTTDFATGRGSSVTRTCVINSTAAYQMTGTVQAALATKLLTDDPKKSGFVSSCQAVGHEYMLGAIKNFYPVDVKVY